MSIPAESEDSRLVRWGWALRFSPIIVAVILSALWLAGAPSERPDLRFTAPSVARPASSIGLRAWQMARDDDGHIVVGAPDVVVELRNAEGSAIARTTLSRSQVEGLEGTMTLPGDLDGRYALIAIARIDGDDVAVERSLYVSNGIDSRRKKGRVVNAFQVYELGPLRVSSRKDAPKVLDARVEEGACVPELPCSLIVWTDRWAGMVRIRSLTGVQIDDPVSSATDGFARFSISVGGSEGRVEVAALAPDRLPLATREVRIPLVPGGLVVRASSRDGSIELDWTSLGPRGPVLVDVFSDSRWVSALSLAPDAPRLGPLPPGVWRIQARADLFSEQTAGVALVAVGNTPDDRLDAAANAAVAEADRRGLDPLAMAILENELEGDADRALSALFAIPSFDVVETGPGVSASVGNDRGGAAEQERRRWIAAGTIMLLGLIVSTALFRVELISEAWARHFLEMVGDGKPLSTRSGSGRGLWAFVLFVFVLMAVLALSKRWF